MKKLLMISTIIFLMIFSSVFTGCTAGVNNDLGEYIISAEEAVELIENGAVLVDGQNNMDAYNEGHITGAISITRGEVAVFTTYPNALIDQATFEALMSSKGIEKEDLVLIYDNNKTMDAARIWWTMFGYGHENVKVISGGLEALKLEGLVVNLNAVESVPSNYKAEAFREDFLVTMDDVIGHLNYPSKDVKFIDTRTQEEYDAGTIPTSILIPFDKNLFSDETFKPTQQISILYKENEIKKDDTIIMYCKTSIRGAETFLALYNAGFENVRLYDGAYIEWSSDPALPIQMPDNTPVQSNMQDES